MRILYLACGDSAHIPDDPAFEVHRLPESPSRTQLRMLDDAARAALPEDPTPSLNEIAKNPEVAHLGSPRPAPQQPGEELRFVVAGTDASLSAVLTRMMRGDYLWASVGYVPVDPSSPAARNWGLPAQREEQVRVATSISSRPTPLIRSDSGIAVAGSASVTDAHGDAMQGEVVVDSEVLLNQPHKPKDARFFSQFGVRLVPMTDAPGLAAVRLTTPIDEVSDGTPPGMRQKLGAWIVDQIGPVAAQSWYETPALKWLVAGAPVRAGGVDPRTMLTGRALQAGGMTLLVTIDGVPAKRATDKAVFYRHLRDLQMARPPSM